MLCSGLWFQAQLHRPHHLQPSVRGGAHAKRVEAPAPGIRTLRPTAVRMHLMPLGQFSAQFSHPRLPPADLEVVAKRFNVPYRPTSPSRLA